MVMDTVRVLAILVSALLAIPASSGCGERASPSSAATAQRAPAEGNQPSPAREHQPSSETTPVTSTRVTVTGVLERRGDQVEICPGRSVGPCPGIRVEGKVEDAWLSERGKVSVWRLTGAYDGTTLVLDAPAQATTLANQPDYRNSCPELQKHTRGGNPDLRLFEIVQAFVREHTERVAGEWWDRERQTMVIWVTGDPADLRRRLAERAPGVRVCVQGQARFSQAELERARAQADRVLAERGIALSSSAGDVVLNRVVYEVEVVDARTLAQLARDAGDAIAVVAFIELLEQPLERIPVAPARGDVALVTEKTRGGGGMSALGRFTVHYDPERRCVYFESEPGERLLPVWPYGFWATANPLRIFDYDDNLVGRAGEAIELGGGQVEIEHLRTENACGAKLAWIGRPQAPAQPRSPAPR